MPRLRRQGRYPAHPHNGYSGNACVTGPALRPGATTLCPRYVFRPSRRASAKLNGRGAAASATFVLWDFLLTFNNELQIIWRGKRWTLLRAGFLVVRYMTLTCLAYVLFCWCHYLRPTSVHLLTYSLLVTSGSHISSSIKVRDPLDRIACQTLLTP